MTTTVLLDHVSAYAAAVRAHLADLSPEQVDDLTDGLEADLAEALADGEGPVVTGEIPIGRAAAAAGIPAPTEPSRVIDLTRRFGPAADYAAELRVAAGLGAPGPLRVARTPVRSRFRAAVVDPVAGLVARWHDALRPFLATAQGQALVAFLAALRPLWWVLRGWVWYVIVGALFFPLVIERFVPLSPATWLLLGGLVALSISIGRGLGARRRVWHRVIVAASVVALLWAPWATSEFRRTVESRLGTGATEYVETVVYEPVYTDGVVVDGVQVSNLFVYDADGNPLTGVQIVDDRGRPVRTTLDDGSGEWYLPGVDEPWRFVPAEDAAGRVRWNVYPLAGAPTSAWEYDDDGSPVPTEELRLPPRPFEKAPAVVVPGASAAGVPADEVAEGTGSERIGEE